MRKNRTLTKNQSKICLWLCDNAITKYVIADILKGFGTAFKPSFKCRNDSGDKDFFFFSF